MKQRQDRRRGRRREGPVDEAIGLFVRLRIIERDRRVLDGNVDPYGELTAVVMAVEIDHALARIDPVRDLGDFRFHHLARRIEQILLVGVITLKAVFLDNAE